MASLLSRCAGVRGLRRRAGWLCAPALLVSLACGGDDALPVDPPAAEAPPAAAAPAPNAPDEPPRVDVEERVDGTVVARTITPDGEVFEAEYGRENQLPSNFPDDVPLYGNAKPLSSMAAPAHGTVVNLRTADTPEQVFAWYREHYAQQGWEIEQQIEERGRSMVLARKGNRVSSVVIMGVPGATQALLTVAEDR